MRHILLIPLLLCWQSVAAVGQTPALTGTVTDSLSGRPLAGVAVAIYHSNISTRTDATGEFRLDGVGTGEQLITFFQRGYRILAFRLRLDLEAGDDVFLGTIALARSRAVGYGGFVTDSATGQPVANVRVGVPDQDRWTSTDSSGRFDLRDLEGRMHTLVVQRIGYRSAAVSVDLTDTQDSWVELGRLSVAAVDATVLEDVTVTAEGRQSMVMPDFERLKRVGSGRFITARDIESLSVQTTSDVLRRLGGVYAGNGAQGCQYQIFIDGTRSSTGDVNMIQPHAIAGIEVYRGPASIPIRYQTPGNTGCGLVAIWTKDAANRGRP